MLPNMTCFFNTANYKFQTRLHQPLSVTPMLHTPRASRTAPKSHKLPKRTASSVAANANVNANANGSFTRDARSCDNISNYAARNGRMGSIVPAAAASGAVPPYAKVSLEKLKRQRAASHHRQQSYTAAGDDECDDDGGFGAVVNYPFYSQYNLGRHSRIQPSEVAMHQHHGLPYPIRLTDSPVPPAVDAAAAQLAANGRLTAHLYPRSRHAACPSNSEAAPFLNNNAAASHYEVIPAAAETSKRQASFVDDSDGIESSLSGSSSQQRNSALSSEDAAATPANNNSELASSTPTH